MTFYTVFVGSRAAKQYATDDGSSMGAYQWCSHLTNAYTMAPALSPVTAMLTRGTLQIHDRSQQSRNWRLVALHNGKFL